MGKSESEEMKFWTQEEYLKFSESIMDKPIAFYAFEMLYWTGIREGELLALTPADLDFDAGTVRINKSYQRIDREDIITEPKTPKSKRVVRMPDFLVEEMQEFIRMLYGIGRDDKSLWKGTEVDKYYAHTENMSIEESNRRNSGGRRKTKTSVLMKLAEKQSILEESRSDNRRDRHITKSQNGIELYNYEIFN